MTSGTAPVYFTDENALGLGKLLVRSGRADVVYPGHQSFQSVPLGTPDLEWLPVVGAAGLIVITRDKRIRTRPAELNAFREHGVRAIFIGGKQDLGPHDQVRLFLENERRILRLITKLGAGPWALQLSASGVRELAVPEL